ncbi:glutathione S-transferase N-terminal domain-containing protein [Pseudomonas aeruginosa]|nr:glutathione S-transferase N-terminal domain-containing protein [Pseudomonas aeruginosa]MDF5964008.1 glutathione S-transferase N-terminal domain-containing protein [Pseudomonas aeruginosa]
MKHTLYFSPGACSLAPHILLEWIGAPYEIVKVSPGSIELYNLNSSGTVPVLTRTDGWKLSQAGAIITYLVERFPEKCLGGDRTVDGIAEFAHWIAFSLVTFTLLSSLFLHRKGTYPQRQRIILIQKMS